MKLKWKENDITKYVTSVTWSGSARQAARTVAFSVAYSPNDKSVETLDIKLTFLVACIVAIWIICNEIISILENIKDMGVTIPAFLIPLVTHVKSQVEDKVNIDTEKEDSEGE